MFWVEGYLAECKYVATIIESESAIPNEKTRARTRNSDEIGAKTSHYVPYPAARCRQDVSLRQWSNSQHSAPNLVDDDSIDQQNLNPHASRAMKRLHEKVPDQSKRRRGNEETLYSYDGNDTLRPTRTSINSDRMKRERRLPRWTGEEGLRPTRLPSSVIVFAFISLVCNLNGLKGSLIIGDSAIEIQEVDSENSGANNDAQTIPQMVQDSGGSSVGSQTVAQSSAGDTVDHHPNIILGSTNGLNLDLMGAQLNNGEPVMQNEAATSQESASGQKNYQPKQLRPSRPSPPSPVAGGKGSKEDITDGDGSSRPSHDYELKEMSPEQKLDRQAADAEKVELGEILSAKPNEDRDDDAGSKQIAGKVVDFELTPAGGHNKAKIKKKKKKKKMEEEASYKKKWVKKKKMEKKAEEKKHKELMKKKKEEGEKKKKKWGHEEHGLKKKGKFKKKKWGKKFKKGKGVKKGKKGHKSLKDKGHKSTGFKTVYHKEEYGKSSKWHDIKREKKWDEKAKKWKKKWKKEKGKKYKGEHMKKFEKKKKEGKKYKKEKKHKFKKFKKEKFEKGKKMKKEEHDKKKEGGEKKEMKKKKKKKMKKD